MPCAAAQAYHAQAGAAVDYDEVCGYLPAFIEFCNATRGTKLKLEDFHSYMFWEVEGCKLATRERRRRACTPSTLAVL